MLDNITVTRGFLSSFQPSATGLLQVVAGLGLPRSKQATIKIGKNMILEEEEKEFVPYTCNKCDNIGMRQVCKEHSKVHGHGLVHLKQEYKNGSFGWWLCNACSEREQ